MADAKPAMLDDTKKKPAPRKKGTEREPVTVREGDTLTKLPNGTVMVVHK